MPSLRPSTGSVSSLLRTSVSLANQAQAIQDQQMAYEWGSSGYSDAAYQKYSDYINGRVSALNTAGGLTNASKALSMMTTLRAANRTYVSAGISRQTMQVMIGNASLTDKYNYLTGAFTQANSNGDATLAQSLMGQAYSVYQQIQLQNQQATDAANANIKAGGTKAAKGYGDAADNMTADLKAFNIAYAHAGPDQLNKLTTDFLKSHKEQYAAIGVVPQPGMKPNYFDIVSGAVQAISKIYNNAYDVVTASGQDGSAWNDKVTKLVGSIPTAFGTMNYNDLNQAAANPNNYHLKLDPEFGAGKSQGAGGGTNPQVGYRYDPKLGVVPVRSETPWINIPGPTANRLSALGLQAMSKPGSNMIEVTQTKQTPEWLKKAIPSNGTTHLFMQPNGDIQFESTSVGGAKIYTITTHDQLYQKDETGYKLLSGASGSAEKASLSPGGGVPGSTADGKSGPHLSLKSDFVNTDAVNNLINQANETWNVVNQNNERIIQAAQAALPPVQLPPPPSPVSIVQATPKSQANVIAPSSIVQKTATPQQLQPASGNLQSGGPIGQTIKGGPMVGGIKL
jgi:hypothetical protein